MSVFYALKKQGMTGHRLAGLRAFPAFYDLTEVVKHHAVTANLNQCADNGTHHVAEKTVGLDAEIPLRGC